MIGPKSRKGRDAYLLGAKDEESLDSHDLFFENSNKWADIMGGLTNSEEGIFGRKLALFSFLES